MRFKKGSAAAVVLLIVIGGWLVSQRLAKPAPTLVFLGYTNSTIPGCEWARFELRNASGRSFWLSYHGADFPLNPPWVVQPAMPIPKSTPTTQMVYSVQAGSCFYQGVEVNRNQSLRLNYPLRAGEAARKIGVIGYWGNYSDGNEFLGHLGIRQDSPASVGWSPIGNLWERLRRKFRAPHRQEIWCEEVLSYSSAMAGFARQNHPPTIRPLTNSLAFPNELKNSGNP